MLSARPNGIPTHIKRRSHVNAQLLRATLFGVLAVFVRSGACGSDESFSHRIVGHWQNLDPQPSRVLKLLPDGTWQLMYFGPSDMQMGAWKIEGRTLIRSYDTGEQRPSEIVELHDSELVLRTQIKDANTGQFVKQTDHYKRISDETPATNVTLERGTQTVPGAASRADDLSKYEHWITGDVFEQDHQLMFRCDKTVQGDPAGDVVFLGSTPQVMNVIVPLLSKAAEQHKKLRLYGVLLPIREEYRKTANAPNAEFRVWKLHSPDDPDELPANQKIIIGPNDRVPGYKIEAPKPAP